MHPKSFVSNFWGALQRYLRGFSFAVELSTAKKIIDNDKNTEVYILPNPMGVKSMDIIIKKIIANYLSVPQRMISFVALKERDFRSLLPVVLPAECM